MAGPLHHGDRDRPFQRRYASAVASSFCIEDFDRNHPPAPRPDPPTPLLPFCYTCGRPIDPAGEPFETPDGFHAACYAAIRGRLRRHEPEPWHPLAGLPGYEGTTTGRLRSTRGGGGPRELRGRANLDGGMVYTIRRQGVDTSITKRRVAALATEAAAAGGAEGAG